MPAGQSVITEEHRKCLLDLCKRTGGKRSPYWLVLVRVDRELRETNELERLLAA
jgi:hypothetical protein